MSIPLSIRLCSALALFVLVATSCDTPERLYGTLSGVPQLLPLGTTSYAVGDTMTLSGKLGGPHANVVVQVGGVTAHIVAQFDSVDQLSTPTGPDQNPASGTTYNREVDYVSVVITAAMGIGANRPVLVTVNKIALSGGNINISATRPYPARSDTLNYVDTAAAYVGPNQGGTAIMARGDNGDGKVYWLSGDTLKLSQVGGAVSTLMTGLHDQNGVFHNIGSEGTFDTYMALDESGRYIYASLITDSLPSDTIVAFRFIKIDLTASTIVTLNRTALPVNPNDVTPAYVAGLTMTGPLGSVFLPPLSQIFPAANGTIYFVADGIDLYQNAFSGTAYSAWPAGCNGLTALNSAVGKIDASGTVSYLMKSNCGFPSGLPIVTSAGFVDLLPTLNVTHPWNWIDAIDPDSGVIYASGGGTAPGGQSVSFGDAKIAYNIRTQQTIATLAPAQTIPPTNVSGPFASIDGQYWVLGVVRGGGHKVWVQSLPTASLPSLIEVMDFDALLVSPYVAVKGNLPGPTDAAGAIEFSVYTEAIINHTSGGDPLIAVQLESSFGSQEVLIPSADAPSGSGAHTVGAPRSPRSH